MDAHHDIARTGLWHRQFHDAQHLVSRTDADDDRGAFEAGSADGRARKTASTSGMSASRFATRSRLVAKRASVSHSGRSTARQNAPQNFSAKTATIRWPSRVARAP